MSSWRSTCGGGSVAGAATTPGARLYWHLSSPAFGQPQAARRWDRRPRLLIGLPTSSTPHPDCRLEREGTTIRVWPRIWGPGSTWKHCFPPEGPHRQAPVCCQPFSTTPSSRPEAIVADGPPAGAAGATRYRVTLPLEYRRRGAAWHSAVTENVSRTGMRFCLSEDLLGLVEERSEHRVLELCLKLRRVGFGTARSPIRCHGSLVRVETPGSLRTQQAVAVAFDGSH